MDANGGSHWRAITAKREKQIECETFLRAHDIELVSMISVFERRIVAEFPLLSGLNRLASRCPRWLASLRKL